MTKAQGGRPSPARLDRDTVVRAALDVLDEEGLDAVSTRAIATRLGVRMNTVLWHVKSKARLRELMADAILGQVDLADLPEDWRERAAEVPRRLRRALLAHRDGASAVVGAHAAEPGTLRFAEALAAALIAGGVPRVAWTLWTLVHLTLGLVREEQAASGDDRLADALDAAPGDYPSLRAVADDLEPTAFAQRLDHGVTLVLRTLEPH
ncbi:TetR/AcrR family transcriptional regulator C-terminal domain-containing protein [Saccharothrix deserti]|uniref:TetR/AcrR family transcriptional regulator C-terminal domain-containing protein n=1 Tax=Saccharothrix deserti TaxID=2593674 RepID=UPI00131B78EE|nr:TetR/AcrR family transcriptional regulator C-terminal domain-containing protein [Saccharothrix deserti]